MSRYATSSWSALVSAFALTAFMGTMVAVQLVQDGAGKQILLGALFGAPIALAWASIAASPVVAIEPTDDGLVLHRRFGAPVVAPFAAIVGLRRFFARNGVTLMFDVAREGIVARYVAVNVRRADAEHVLAHVNAHPTRTRAAIAPLAGLVPFLVVVVVALPAVVGAIAGPRVVAFLVAYVASLIAFCLLARKAKADLRTRAA